MPGEKQFQAEFRGNHADGGDRGDDAECFERGGLLEPESAGLFVIAGLVIDALGRNIGCDKRASARGGVGAPAGIA